jgi:hypothetical protein
VSAEREAALLGTEARCPRCGAAREPDQVYCLECGLGLPALTGTIPLLRGTWIRRVGWYPGDWIWIPAVALLVAAAAAAIAILVTVERRGSDVTTIVGSTNAARLTTSGTRAGATSHVRPRTGRTSWPARRSGWTVVLGSYPVTAGAASAFAGAGRAVRSGLPDVGVLDSSHYASLHPGYYVVFTGIYSSEARAQAALDVASASGFAGAYPRLISR